METRHLRHFLAVADCGSLTRAAEQLGIAQPALSQSLARMERELGVALLARSRRGAVLTPAGRAILDDVRQSVARIDAALHRAREVGAGRAGRLVIGFVSAALYRALPRALRELAARFPDVEVVLREMSNAEQARALERGDIDIGLLHTPIAVNGPMREKRVSRDRFVAALPADFPHRDDTITLARLAQIDLVWFPADQLPLVRAGILGAFRAAGSVARITQEANRSLTVLACVAGGRGASLLPSSVRALNFAGVRFCDIADGDGLPFFELSAVWPARSRATLADAFAALIPADPT